MKKGWSTLLNVSAQCCFYFIRAEAVKVKFADGPLFYRPPTPAAALGTSDSTSTSPLPQPSSSSTSQHQQQQQQQTAPPESAQMILGPHQHTPGFAWVPNVAISAVSNVMHWRKWFTSSRASLNLNIVCALCLIASVNVPLENIVENGRFPLFRWQRQHLEE